MVVTLVFEYMALLTVQIAMIVVSLFVRIETQEAMAWQVYRGAMEHAD